MDSWNPPSQAPRNPMAQFLSREAFSRALDSKPEAEVLVPYVLKKGSVPTPVARPEPVPPVQKIISETSSVDFPFSEFTAIFDAVRKDVYLTRDRLLNLPRSRQALIERRLEFVARKYARLRGEKTNRTLSLPEILRESFRTSAREKSLGQIALEAFVAEVALHHVFQLFTLKALEGCGLRSFSSDDWARLNFAVHSFLNQKAHAFTQDRHSWQFVRPSIYSWYSLSAIAIQDCKLFLTSFEHSYRGHWSDKDLALWMLQRRESWGLDHLEMAKDGAQANALWDFVEKTLGLTLLAPFQGMRIAKKVFFPCLESGGIALSALERILPDRDVAQGYLQQSLWASETEALETFFVEVMALLKILDRTRRQGDHSLVRDELFRIPQGIRVAQLPMGGALELHAQEQLPLGSSAAGSDPFVQAITASHQGSAALIQQNDGFDLSVVLDHPDRNRSSKWLKALTEQLTYWRTNVSSSTNLNWGELHLQLALSKLKDSGYCLYFSHRVLPESGDGERFRRTLLNMATFEYFFMDLPEEVFGPYRYLYVFSKDSNKARRDGHRVRFGCWNGATSSLQALEESSSTQLEILERGWDQVFVRGAAPLVRHLSHKFPKLFQVATVQPWNSGKDGAEAIQANSLFERNQLSALEIRREGQKLVFSPLSGRQPQERLVVFPHNAADLPWLTSVLNSAPVQFWIRMQVLQDAGPLKYQELRSLPIFELSNVAPSLIQEHYLWLGKTKLSEQTLLSWATQFPIETMEEGGPLQAQARARFVALAKRRAQLDSTLQKYKPLFDVIDLEKAELNPENVRSFYPNALLCTLQQTPDVKIMYVGKELTSTNSTNWVIRDVSVFSQGQRVQISVQTKQGPQIQLYVPFGVSSYVAGQLKKLQDFTWGEVLALLRIPRDINLFTAQTSEITRVVQKVLAELQMTDRILEMMMLDLFEIAPQDRQYLIG